MPFADGFLYTHYRLTWLEPCYGKSHRKASLGIGGREGAPTIETLFLLSERFRKSIDWIVRGEGN
jgi:hypothetical protein